MPTLPPNSDADGSDDSISETAAPDSVGLATDAIRLRGVTVNNLKSVDLDLPHRKLLAFCGVSGSGKTSLALDTLYAEGQRRYIESFSAYTRQFLDQLDKPEADRIEGIPPSIAVTRKTVSRSSRATVGSATQLNEYLQLLFSAIGEVVCHGCREVVQQESPDTAAERLAQLPNGTRAMIGFRSLRGTDRTDEQWIADLTSLGYRRCVVGGNLFEIGPALLQREGNGDGAGLGELDSLELISDRLKLAGPTDGNESVSRLLESLEAAMEAGRGTALVWTPMEIDACANAVSVQIDGQNWQRTSYSRQLHCEKCDLEYPDPQPPLLNYNNSLGACSACEGFGNITELDMDLVVPDRSKSLREGAITPWNTPAYAHELDELLALAPDYGIPVEVPFEELTVEHLALIQRGVPERDFGGLDGFVAWLERRKYKMHIRVFLSRWRSYSSCPQCAGARLNREALAVKIAGKNLAEFTALPAEEAHRWLSNLELTPTQQQAGQRLLKQVSDRLGYLDRIGLGRLSLDRPLRTLSGGEAQRVALTSALGSDLSGMLYVLDEPSAGLHPEDLPRLVRAVRALRDRGNSVALVEHSHRLIQAADEVIELGPGAGEFGGKVLYQGAPEGLPNQRESRLGDWLTGRRFAPVPETRREPSQGWLRLVGAKGNNLKDVTLEFPLGVLCVVSGVSGAGKSTLVTQTLYPAVAAKLGIEGPAAAEYEDLLGAGQLDEVLLIDQSPIGRTPRSNPVTYVKAFDPIRSLFAGTVDAKAQGFKAGHFSFNVDGGRCDTCQGDGYTQIDMQLMADVYMKCADCQGLRYRREVLEVRYRGLNIADVLDLSVREAFTFFRGQKKILARLKHLIDVGLDYLRLGQPANTLSGGEAQRLKLANYVSAAKRGRTLFVMDEPTTGLHYSDVMQLLDCFESLTSMGHSLIVVEHHLLMMQMADYLIDLGPGGAEAGGSVVVAGTPEEVALREDSPTGRHLAAALRDSAAAAKAAEEDEEEEEEEESDEEL